MIDEGKIDASFRQNGNSCVLASYAIAFNYFTRLDVGECFEAYCQHFSLDYLDRQDAENQYNEDFHFRYNENRSGYQVLIDLHENSTVSAFVKARSLFDYKLYQKILPYLEETEKVLQNQEALLNITSCDGWCHSITVFYSENGCSKKDTNQPIIERMNSLYDLKNLADALLLIKK